MSRRSPWIALAAVLIASGCQPAPPAAKPLVVATIYPLWDFSRQVAGDRAEVVSLVPPGVEPHDWEPAPRDVAQVQRAIVVVHTGTDLDAWTRRLLANLKGPAVLVDASRGLGLLKHGETADPHVWLDPTLARAQVETIASGLAQADPGGRAIYEENAKRLITRLEGLDQELTAGLSQCARREIVTSHAAFAYLARRYRLTQVSLMGLAPEAEPSPSDLAAIVKTARRLKVTHVFYEPLVSARLGETLAREIGARPLPLNPIEVVTAEEIAAGKGYLELMRDNLGNLRTALGCP